MADDAPLEDLFNRWRRLHDQGQETPPEQLCDRPELVMSLRARIDAYLSSGQPRAEPPTAVLTRPESPGVSTPFDVTTSVPRVFAGYPVERVLGRGGMGVIYQVRHPQLGLSVALKTMRGEIESVEGVQRFLREARAVALLNHPNIVRLFDVDHAEGSYYYTMALVPGGSLKDHRQELAVDPRRVAALMEKVARGVQHAHEHGILHRDLKPGNILLDAEGEPLVSDFGLAKFLNVSDELTTTGNMLGTLPYMAPELLGGQDRKARPANDVWALGVILYELLTGRRPFVGEESVELIQRIVTTEPARLRVLNPQLDRGLETIVLKCLEKSPSRRYASAGAVADDLGRWLRGEPLSARPPAWPRRVAAWFKRHPWRNAAVLGGIIAIALIPALLWLADPERPLRAIERDLAAGNEITLVDDHGNLRWYRWRTGEDPAKFVPGKDGACVLTSNTFALVELLPKAPAHGYRLEAWVSQEEGFEAGAVGLYFSHSEKPDGSGKHYFAALNFVERGSLAGWATFNLFGFWDPTLGPVANNRPSLGKSVQFQIKQGEPRHLVVEVRPPRVRTLFNNTEAADVTFDELNARAANLAKSRTKNGEPIVSVPPEFRADQGLGLFVFVGSAKFRSVTIRPLSP
jgi:serine/threonine-protein kinase